MLSWRRKHKGFSCLKTCSVLFLCTLAFNLSAQNEDNKEVSASLTKNFSPSYIEFKATDSIRTPTVRFKDFENKKLVFYDDFRDNRNGWPYWTSGADSIMRSCVGLADRKICRGKNGNYVNGFTNMEQGRKILYAFTPEENLKYSNNVPIPLAKNYVLTFNPLSIKQVSKLPSPYYEGNNEHTTRIHNSFNGKDFYIETNIETNVGTWGLLFGNISNMQPYYYFKVNADNTYDLFAIYPQRKNDLVSISAGNLGMPYQQLKNLKIKLSTLSKSSGYKVEFFANGNPIGSASLSNLYLLSLDIGFRLDHNSIDGNNILIVNNISVYEQVVQTYIPEGLTIDGKWKGGLYDNNKKVYNVNVDFSEKESGNINGLITFSHEKYKDIAITKKFVAHREKNIINFEDKYYQQYGITNDVVLFSLLQKGNMELLNPDSMVMQSFLANNLHQFGDFDKELDLQSNTIYLTRYNRILEEKSNFDELFSAMDNYTVEIENIYFYPDEARILDNVRTTQSLDQLARSLQKYLANKPETFVIIHGHTDIGAEQMLSLTRAFTIKSELMKRGINNPIFCIGHGNSQRLSEKRGDAKNRRVELEIKTTKQLSFGSENITINEGGVLALINQLPDGDYVIQADFSLSPGKQYVVFKKDGKENDWEIPNTSGGARQSLRIKRYYKNHEYGTVLEFWLDEVNVLTQTLYDFDSFGFKVLEGKMTIDNVNIFSLESN